MLRVKSYCNGLCVSVSVSEASIFSRGGYSSMIWVGTCRWDLKSRPIFIQILPKNETHFYTRVTNFKQNLLKMSPHFPKLLSFQANFKKAFKQISKILVSDWWNWAYVCTNLRKFWKYGPSLYQFLHWVRGHRYTKRLILRPISAARPRIDLCTKNPPPGIFCSLRLVYFVSMEKTWHTFSEFQQQVVIQNDIKPTALHFSLHNSVSTSCIKQACILTRCKKVHI